MGADKASAELEILGRQVRLDRITNPALRRVIEDRLLAVEEGRPSSLEWRRHDKGWRDHSEHSRSHSDSYPDHSRHWEMGK